jgi:hypothetical protein
MEDYEFNKGGSMITVLILIILSGDGVAVNSIKFNNMKACEKALEDAKEKGSVFVKIRGVCAKETI